MLKKQMCSDKGRGRERERERWGVRKKENERERISEVIICRFLVVA